MKAAKVIAGGIRALPRGKRVLPTIDFLGRWHRCADLGDYLVIAGTDNNNLLHIRIFDGSGTRVTDTDQRKLPTAQAAAIANLKQQLPGLLPPHELTAAEKTQAITEATLIATVDPHIEGILDKKSQEPISWPERVFKTGIYAFSGGRVLEPPPPNYSIDDPRPDSLDEMVLLVNQRRWDGLADSAKSSDKASEMGKEEMYFDRLYFLNVDFRGANLTYFQFAHCIFENVKFDRAVLNGATFLTASSCWMECQAGAPNLISPLTMVHIRKASSWDSAPL